MCNPTPPVRHNHIRIFSKADGFRTIIFFSLDHQKLERYYKMIIMYKINANSDYKEYLAEKYF